MTSQCMDWCIHIFTRDVLIYYWYQRVRKTFGFVDNKKEYSIVLFTLILTRDVLDSDVTLPDFLGRPAFITSTTHRHIRYVIHNPFELWASYDCLHLLRRNMCKYKVKVLNLLHPQLVEGMSLGIVAF